MNEVQLRHDHYIIEGSGKPMVAMVSVEEFKIWMRRRDEFFQQIEQTRERNEEVDSELTESEVAEAVAAARRDNAGSCDTVSRTFGVIPMFGGALHQKLF